MIRNHTYGEYIEKIKAFHGHVAPGVVLGGFMVEIAYQNLPAGEFFDAISETHACLPDAVQILTPCTIGNSWLRIVDLGRFALSFFEKNSGIGIRVYLDNRKLEEWPELKTFFFKLKPKKEQDYQRLMTEIENANTSIFSHQRVAVDLNSVKIEPRDGFSLCSECGEGYPVSDSDLCLGCQGNAPYLPL